MNLESLAKIKKRAMRAQNFIASGNTPDGTLHLGALREQLIADVFFRVINKEAPVNQFFFVYDYDGLKSDNAYDEFEKYAGTPLINIPSPQEEYQSFSEYNLQPFVAALDELRINCKIFRTSELYRNGSFKPFIEQAYEKSSLVNRILGREINSSPFIPLCHSCGKYCYNVTLNSEVECTNCRTRFKFDISGPGKLRWEIEWASIWSLFEICIEPIGPIHTSQKGKTFEKAVDIAELIYNCAPPEPVTFQTVSIFDIGCSFSKEAQCCRRNIKFTYQDWKKIAPPELLRYIMLHGDFEDNIIIDVKRYLPQYYKQWTDYIISSFESKNTDEVGLIDLIKIGSDLSVYYKYPFDYALNLIKKPSILSPNNSDIYTYGMGLDKMLEYTKNYCKIYDVIDVPKISFEDRFGLLTITEKSIISYLIDFIIGGNDVGESCKLTADFYRIERKQLYRLLYWTITGEVFGQPISKVISNDVVNQFKSILHLT